MTDTIRKIGLVAGEGLLPTAIATEIQRRQIPLATFSLHRSNRSQLKAYSPECHAISPGLFEKNLALFRQSGISHLVFAGKVNKWLLFCKPKLDARALKALQSLVFRNDDQIMLGFIREIEAEGITVLPQTDFLQSYFVPAGCLTQTPLTHAQEKDLAYGFPIAKAMGQLDVGQTIVVNQGMLLAVEAIEGTDECLKRAGQWGNKKGGMVIKVAKPGQDQRFDVPTVGLRTLKTMKKAGLTVLATEANETLFLEPEAMTGYANHHGMTIISVDSQQYTNALTDNNFHQALQGTLTGSGHSHG